MEIDAKLIGHFTLSPIFVTIQAIEETKNVKNLSKTFDSVDKMFEELDK